MPRVDGEEVDGVGLFGVFVVEALPAFGEQEVAGAQGEVYLGREDAGAEEDFVAVAEGAEDVDAVLRHAGVDDTGEEFGTLVHRVAGYETAEAVSDDCCSTFERGETRLVAREAFEELDESGTEEVRTESPVVPIVVNS